MKADIIRFLKRAYELYKIEAYYIPVDDLYVVTKCGKSVQNFNTNTFYQIPKLFRLQEWRGIIQLGINHNLGEKSHKDQIYQLRNIGIRINLAS